jgi:hypothetical protein
MPGEIAEAEPSRQRIVLRVCGAYLESMLLHAFFDSAAKAVVEQRVQPTSRRRKTICPAKPTPSRSRLLSIIIKKLWT